MKGLRTRLGFNRAIRSKTVLLGSAILQTSPYNLQDDNLWQGDKNCLWQLLQHNLLFPAPTVSVDPALAYVQVKVSWMAMLVIF